MINKLRIITACALMTMTINVFANTMIFCHAENGSFIKAQSDVSGSFNQVSISRGNGFGQLYPDAVAKIIKQSNDAGIEKLLVLDNNQVIALVSDGMLTVDNQESSAIISCEEF